MAAAPGIYAMSDRITATYLIESGHSLQHAADVLAGEQSSGTFVDLPLETEALQSRHGARVESIQPLGLVDEPSLPGATSTKDRWRQATVEVSYPVENIGPDLPNLRTMLAGNLFELQELSGIRLLDVAVPPSFAKAFPGPAYGIEGTRDAVDVTDGPIIGTIIKPSVGLSPTETAEVVRSVVNAGVDFIKDDELIADPPYSRIADRIETVMDVIHRHEDRTGKRVMYACNITGSVEAMRDRHDLVHDAGGNCVMVSLNSVGLSGLLAIRRHAELPIHGHRNGWGALSRHPLLGASFPAFQLLWRLAGADHLHVNGLENKFAEENASVIRSATAVQTPIADPDDRAMPVFSSGQWAGQAPATYEALGNADLMYLCGGGIHGHPDGPAAGVAHLRQGWEAAVAGIPLADHAENNPELARAIDHYGPIPTEW